VEYILTLANERKVATLPLEGVVRFAAAPEKGIEPQSAYVITASYEDNGANGMPSLSTTRQFMFKSPFLKMSEATDLKGGIRKANAAGYDFVENIKHNSSITFTDIDLTSVNKLNFTTVEMGQMKGGEINVRLDSAEGKSLGSVSFANAPKMEVQSGIFMRPSGISVNGVSGKHNIILIFKNERAGDGNLFMLSQLSLSK
ncbi:MAG: carbohydrate-binding protein, partial [Bacteroidia bacterium]|nr:carbohydrate-binding protein [Bacteroidia bacterium]